MDEANPFTFVGIIMIALGVIFVVLPYISRYIDVSEIPWIILWVYRSANFTFATSPILIIISVISLILAYMRR